MVCRTLYLFLLYSFVGITIKLLNCVGYGYRVREGRHSSVQCFDTYSVNLRSGFNFFRVIAYIFSALSAVCLFSLVCLRTFFLCSFGGFCVCFCAWSACYRRTDVCDVCTFNHLLIDCVGCFTRSFFANIT